MGSVAIGTLWNLLLKDILQSLFQMLEDLAKCSHMRKLCNNKWGRSLESYSREEKKKCYLRDFLIQQYKTNVCIVIITKIWNTNLINIFKCTYLKNGKKARWRIKILIFLSSMQVVIFKLAESKDSSIQILTWNIELKRQSPKPPNVNDILQFIHFHEIICQYKWEKQ